MKVSSLFALATTATAGLLMPSAVNAVEIVHGVDCQPCANADPGNICTMKVSVDLFSSKTGYFKIEGCDGVNPTLHLKVGETYKFDQSDPTNWYHLVGFAYEADGAHVPVDELEPGIAPPGMDTTCADTNSCPAPMYFMDGIYRGTYSNNPNLMLDDTIPESDDFGLDAVEPRFFHPLGDWESYGKMETYLKFDLDFTSDIFYFCHVHSGMSARIKLLDSEGNMLSPENTPALPYEYLEISEYDMECGTYNLTDWQLPNDQCVKRFVCPEGDQAAADASIFKGCVDSMNCHMMASMTTLGANSPTLFCHQMIPHHENAINMAKSLLKHSGLTCASAEAEEGDEVSVACQIIPLLMDIINTQNLQIIDMESVLELQRAPMYSDCEVDFLNELEVGRKLQSETEPLTATYEHGIECTPCDDIEGECTINLNVDLFTSELGHYTVDGCGGVNPTLLLEVDRTYKFDQSDVSNWYHLIGFAYEADGAHVPVDELEPGIPPPGTNSNCDETMSCPAPMYFMDGVYQGTYSNNPELMLNGTVAGSEDFGLDAVEPLFFHPIGDWQEYGTYTAYLKFDQSMTQDLFYFCHIHSGMSGRIKLVDATGNKLSEENTPELPYDYDIITPFDNSCGSYGLETWQLPHPQCPSQFVCGKEDLPTSLNGVQLSQQTFATCIESMNCAMLNGMTTMYGGEELLGDGTDDIVLFMRQMIPHHQNAVNMAKSLLKSNAAVCGDLNTSEGDTLAVGCLLEPIVRGIINTQNHQIQTMRGILEVVGAKETADCVVSQANGPLTTPPSPTCAVEERNDDGFCAAYISRLSSDQQTCNCYDFCNELLVGCEGETPIGSCAYPRYGCRSDMEPTPGWVAPEEATSGAQKTSLWFTSLMLGLATLKSVL